MDKIKMLLLTVVLSVTACSPVKVVSTKPKEGFSLGTYKTFDFYKVTEDRELSPTLAKRLDWVKSEVAKQLSARGLQQTSDNPDLYVNLGAVVEEKVQTRETTVRDAPVYMGQRNYSWQSQEIPVGTYEEGTLTVDLVDTKSNELVWQGIASSVVVKGDDSAKKNIATGVEKLFAQIK